MCVCLGDGKLALPQDPSKRACEGRRGTRHVRVPFFFFLVEFDLGFESGLSSYFVCSHTKVYLTEKAIQVVAANVIMPLYGSEW